ncbi:MAG: ATP-binding cassette domain-containing protein [Methanolobus sp.]
MRWQRFDSEEERGTQRQGNSPYSTVNHYLDPLMRISSQVIGSSDDENSDSKKKLLKDIFRKYDLKPEVERMFPHELSGGMIRRVLVSTAVMSSSKIVIADEPTPGLDEKNLNETLGYFKDMANKGYAVILITHVISKLH